MQIQLKQSEIEAGLRLYIIQQGINLVGKTVDVTFTSGRRDNGLSAEVEINDAKDTTQTLMTMTAAEPVAEAKKEAPTPTLFN